MLNFTKLIITLYLQLVLKSVVQTKNYCEPQLCGNTKSHTMCMYTEETPSKSCIKYEKLIKSMEDKQEILDKINSRRNKVASGDIRSIPSAENMMKLEWNEELELFAQRWADQCGKYPAALDSCRDTETMLVGQNVATIYGESPGLNPSTLVDLWYMELFNVNATIISSYKTSLITSEHYDFFTQLMWGETSQVGCGGVKFQEILDEKSKINRTVYRLVCNFLPSGNIVGQHVYRQGIPCDECPTDTNCDLTFTFLCGLIPPTPIIAKNSDKINNSDYYPISLKNISSENVNYMEQNDSVIVTTTKDTEYDTSFDYFSHLFENTRTKESLNSPTSSSCKDVLAVDELIELLKKKLITDNKFKEMLLSTKSAESESKFSDSKVDAIVSKIYSKKTTPLTTKATESDVADSTLLADLVEAVMFRNRDRPSTIVEDMDTQIASEVSPVKVQAELGEIKRNLEFTGHYFFPEDEDAHTTETTDTAYYDMTNLPVSDIVLEIEELKRNTATKDFIDEILDTDIISESTTIQSVAKSESGYG